MTIFGGGSAVRILAPEYDERAKDELATKGVTWMTVEVNSKSYALDIFGLNRLPYEIALEGGYLMGRNIVLLNELGFEAIMRHLEHAESVGLFDRLVPN